MDVKKISQFLSVSPQIFPSQMKQLAEMGFKTLINNRPENEVEDQPSVQDLMFEAARNGMTLISIPVISGKLTEQNASDFGEAMQQAQAPVLAYCRSGMRSTCLWALHEARQADPGGLINFAATIGYDIKSHKEQFELAGRN